MLRADYIERAIAKLAEAVARAVGLRSAGQAEEALAELRAAKAGLPLVAGVVDLLAPRDLRQALGSAELTAQFVRILREEAVTCLALGREREAVRAHHRAERLASVLGDEPTPAEPRG